MHGPEDDEDGLRRLIGDARTVRQVFEAAPAAVVGLEGPDHTIVAANAAWRGLLRRDAFIGRTVRDLLPGVIGQQLIGALDRPFATGVPELITEWRVQFDPGADTPPEDIYIDCVIVPRRSPGGTVTGLVAIVQDVTGRVRDRQAAQRRAAEAEQRYAEARDVIDVLQRQLLPPGLPILPGLAVGGSYLLAGAETAGGDWFDAVPLPDGRAALVIGDVVGHGVAASAAMGQLRAVMHDHLDHVGDIAEALTAVDRLAGRLPAARAATVCVAVVDPADGRISYCTAGHPPPLLIPSGGRARYLPSSGGGPLGTGSAFPLLHDRLGVGDQLLLYSDGIIERPGLDLPASTIELAEAATEIAADRALREDWLATVERLTTQTLELLVRVTGHTDDITLLAAQRTAPPPPLLLDLRAEPAAIPTARKALDEWLYDLGARAEDVVLLRHGVGELVTNAVEHAYGPAPGGILVHAHSTSRGTVEIEVSDRGRWLEHRHETDRGRGLAMASDFVDELRVDTGPSGTTASVRHRLFRPTRLLTTDDLTPAPPARKPLELLLILDQPSPGAPRIRVDGPVDSATAGQLREELQLRTRGGTRPLTVDLTGVTHLASAGVAVLHEAGTRTAAPGRPLLLYAPPGTPAQHVLSTVALPHTTTDPG
ncbi:SpoIIE family protein phosphatase [Actinomadura bangladeshensis]|uniref:SpoIIE family protein phosphatase n=1 Tax=Actinomadura bangladeshensis TaxID=453573 RepID=A0A6L9QDN2_9ACTN|nr:SpoIIE family protein phosphatase [Actinomadura bangladeshensis]NEA22793.1 SpoIIE family protein phosphatase [Actinomadura bangladeshensis]